MSAADPLRKAADALADAVTDVVYTELDDGEVVVCDGPLYNSLTVYRAECERLDAAKEEK